MSSNYKGFRSDYETDQTLFKALDYFDKNFGKSDITYIVKTALNVFNELFLESNNGDFNSRLNSLKKIKDSDTEEITDLLKILNRQQEVSTYIQLAMFNLEHDSDYLEKNSAVISKLTNTKEYAESAQGKLLSEIISVISKDISKNNTLKNTANTKNK